MARKKFLNTCETPAYEILLPLAVKYQYQVYPKVRLSDAVEISNSGLNTEDLWYASKAHFDFVLVQNNRACFGLEVDGPNHFLSEKSPVRDLRKNRICKLLNFDLLRIDAGYLNSLSNHTVLSILFEEILSRRSSPKKWNPHNPQVSLLNGTASSSNNESQHSTLEIESQLAQIRIKGGSTNLQTFRAQENEFFYTATVAELNEKYYCVGQGCAQSSTVLHVDPQQLSDHLSVIELDKRMKMIETEDDVSVTNHYVTKVRSAYEKPGIYPQVRKLMLESLGTTKQYDHFSDDW